MKLLTEELKQKFKQLGRQEGVKDPLVITKFFTPWTNRTWRITEFDEENSEFFGLIEGHEKEWGYVSLLELLSIEGPFGLRIERDLSFEPSTCSELGLYRPRDETEDEYDPCLQAEIKWACGEI